MLDFGTHSGNRKLLATLVSGSVNKAILFAESFAALLMAASNEQCTSHFQVTCVLLVWRNLKLCLLRGMTLQDVVLSLPSLLLIASHLWKIVQHLTLEHQTLAESELQAKYYLWKLIKE